jgi:hypothetical protein
MVEYEDSLATGKTDITTIVNNINEALNECVRRKEFNKNLKENKAKRMVSLPYEQCEFNSPKDLILRLKELKIDLKEDKDISNNLSEIIIDLEKNGVVSLGCLGCEVYNKLKVNREILDLMKRLIGGG